MESSEDNLIAVDLALVPPEWVQERARRINAELTSPGWSFDSTHMPHISLAQLFVMRAALPFFIERVDLILRSASAIPVRALAVVGRESTVSILLDRPPELVGLHENLMDATREWEEQGGTTEAFCSEGEPAHEEDVDWVANYRAHASYRRFIPHITVGHGETPAPEASFEFIAKRVDLFHLGCFCTCRIALHGWTLP